MRRSECNDKSSHTKIAGEKENGYGASCKDAVHAHLLGFPRYTKKNIPRDFSESRENFGVCLFLEA
jgi:hypothetical protein